MKKKYFCLVLVFISFLSFSQNQIEFYNNTSENLVFALVCYDYENESWTSEGWYSIDPYSPKKLDFDNYIGNIYIHAEQENSEGEWGGGYSFCINLNSAFEIRFSDKIECKNSASFSKFKIETGKNTYTFNP